MTVNVHKSLKQNLQLNFVGIVISTFVKKSIIGS